MSQHEVAPSLCSPHKVSTPLCGAVEVHYLLIFVVYSCYIACVTLSLVYCLVSAPVEWIMGAEQSRESSLLQYSHLAAVT